MSTDAAASPELGPLRLKIRRASLVWLRSRPGRFLSRSLFAQMIALAGVYALVQPLFWKFVRFKEAIYDDPFIGAHFFSKPNRAVLVLTITGVLLLFHRRLHWQRLGARWIRLVFTVLILLCCWSLTGFGFNYYTGHAYLADRLLILGLALLSVWRPMFVPLFLAYALLFYGQQAAGIGAVKSTDKFPLVDILVAFSVFLLLRPFARIKAAWFLWFLVCLQATDCFCPGVAKLATPGKFNLMSWIWEDPVVALIPAGWVHGWFGWWSEQQVLDLASALGPAGIVMGLYTAVVELGAPLFLWGRKPAALLLLGGIGLHMGIFSFSGIFFWKWIVIDLLLVAALFMQGGNPFRRARRWRLVAAGLVLVLAYPLWASPAPLGWLDTRITEMYFIEVHTPEGSYRVDHGNFSPYEVMFEQGNFHYINPEPVLTDRWAGTRDYELGTHINQSEVGDIAGLAEREGAVQYDEAKAGEFDEFMRRWFIHANEVGDGYHWIRALNPPNHIQTVSGGNAYGFQRPVTQVQVRFQRVFYDGERMTMLEDKVIRTIDVPAAEKTGQ